MAIIMAFYYCFCPGTGIFSQHLQLVCAPSSAALIPSLFTRHPGGDVKSEAPRPYLAQVWGVTADVWNQWSFSPILPYHCWVQLIHVVQSHKTWLWSWQCWSSLRCWPSRSSLCTKMCLLFFFNGFSFLMRGKRSEKRVQLHWFPFSNTYLICLNQAVQTQNFQTPIFYGKFNI